VKADSTVYIAEIMPNPEGYDSKESEYIKIFSKEDAVLDEYKICNIDDDCYQLTGNIKKNECLKIFRKDFNFVLHNKEEKLILYKDNLIVDQVETKNAPSGKAWICTDSCDWADPSGGCNYEAQPEEPEEIEITEIIPTETKQSSYAEKIYINEIFPSPSEGEEWIELKNNTNEEIDLTNWILDDVEGGSKYYIIPELKIPPHSYISISKSQSGIAFNNNGDEVRLFDNEGYLVNKVIYPSTALDKSYIFQDGNWIWSNTATQEQKNILDEDPPEVMEINAKNDFSKVKKKLRNKSSVRVNITGEVIIPRKIVGKNIFYFTSCDKLIKANFYSTYKGSKKTTGKKIEITDGYLRRCNKGWCLGLGKRSDIEIVGKVKKKKIKDFLVDNKKKSIGEIIEVKGKIDKKSGGYFTVGNNPRIYIPKVIWDEYIKINNIKSVRYKGGSIEAVGILERVNDNYRVLVKDINDFKVYPYKKKIRKAVKTSKIKEKPAVKSTKEDIASTEDILSLFAQKFSWRDWLEIFLIKSRLSLNSWF